MLNESNLVKTLRTLLESEVEEAEIVMSAKSFSRSMQEMIEKIGRLQNEDLPPLSDQMRNNFGAAVSHSFHTQMQSALQSVMDALYGAKDEVDNAVDKMATGDLTFGMDNDMEALGSPGQEREEFDMGPELDVGAEIDDELPEIDVEDEEPLGRAMKESAESRKASLMQIKRKMKILEAQLKKRKKKV